MMFENQRWYDKSLKLSLAVGCIEKADSKLREKLAKVIIKYAIEMNVSAKKPSSILFFRRWYDKDPNLSLAMEYFKNCNDEQRLEIAEYILASVKDSAVKSP